MVYRKKGNDLAIILSDSIGRYPVPASKGGAVPELVEELVKQNNNKQLLDMTVITFFEEGAFKLSKEYSNINFIWVKIPKIVEFADLIVFKIFSFLFPKKRLISMKSTISLLFFIYSVHKLIRKVNFKKIVIENNIPTFCIFKKLGKEYKDRYYFHLHNVPRVSFGCRRIIRNCKKIICVSNYVKEEIKLKSNPIGPVSGNKICVLYNCIDTNVFRPLSEDVKECRKYIEKYCIQENEKIILFCGRISYDKGIDKVLNAIIKLDCKHVVLMIVGNNLYHDMSTDPCMKMLKKLLRQVNSRVIFTGYLPHNELPYIYNIATVAALPSMWEEPAGLTIIEAMSCGVPVITTSAGGIKEYVGNAAIVLERDSYLVDNIKKEIKKLLLNSEYANYYSLKGRERVLQNFSKENYLNNFYEMLKE